jgi:hypothetical protein
MASKKRLKNIPILHDEVKKKTVVLTPTAWETMKVEARIRGISIIELIEEFGRSLVNKKPSRRTGLVSHYLGQDPRSVVDFSAAPN